MSGGPDAPFPSSQRWPYLFTLVVGVAAVFAFWTVAREPRGDLVPARGGTYVEGVAGQPSRINPLYASQNELDDALSSLVFAGLVRLGQDGTVQPDLADSWEVDSAGVRYTFHLREGLIWQDGEELTADDVLFTFGAIADPAFRGDPRLQALFSGVEVSAPDSRHVVFTLPQPYAPFLAYAGVGILPAHLLAGVSAADLYDAEFNRQPIGAGPYRLKDLDPTRAVLEKFDSYHLGEPYIQTIELRFFRDDGSLMMALREGKVDGAFFHPGVGEDDLAFVQRQANLNRRPLPASEFLLLYLNAERPVLADERVRVALAEAVDRAGIAQQVFGGQAQPLLGPLRPGTWAFAPEAVDSFDPQRAAADLDAAGWNVGPAGIRWREGQNMVLTVATNDDPARVAIAEAVAKAWRQLGIEVDVIVEGSTTFVQDVLLPRAFDVALFAIDPGPDPDPYPFWHSSQRGEGGQNLAGFADPDADRVLEAARLTTDQDERATLYTRFDEIFRRRVPAITLVSPEYQYIVKRDVRGVEDTVLFSPGTRFHDVHLWYVRTERSSRRHG